MSSIEVGAMIASQNGVTLYLTNGGEMFLPDNAWKTQEIVDYITPKLANKKTATVKLDLDEYTLGKKIEELTEGRIRIVPASRPIVGTFSLPMYESYLDAIVKVDGQEKVIPNVHRLENQMKRAVQTQRSKGLERFLERLAAVIDSRGHSVDELLNFMERGDLPIADDGSIVAYKSVFRRENGYYVDCHSKSVRQRVGSHVSMPINLVDNSRRVECSTGFHVGRRDYMGSFSGDVITLTKVAPEDVVAVPHNEPDKMRTAAYHIVAELSGKMRALVRSKGKMTDDPEGAKLLGDVIAGNHVGITEHVIVRGAMGRDVTITPVVNAPKRKPVKKSKHRAKVLEIDKKAEVEKKPAPKAGSALAKVRKAAKEVVAMRKLTPEEKAAVRMFRRKNPPSQREIERVTGVAVRTLKRIIEQLGD